VGKASVFLASLDALSSSHRDMTVWVSCWPPVLPDGCDLNLLQECHKKLLGSAESLVTNFQLKSAISSEVLLKNRSFLTWETYKVKQYANRCALSWCYPIKNLMKKINIFVDEEGVNVFILKNCWNRWLVRNLLPVKPAKRLVKPC